MKGSMERSVNWAISLYNQVHQQPTKVKLLTGSIIVISSILIYQYSTRRVVNLLGLAREGNVAGIRRFRGNVDLQKDGEGNTALMLACKYNRTDCIKSLIQAKANVNGRNSVGMTPLHIAITDKSSIEGVESLIANGAKVDIVGLHGWTPLHLAAANGFTPLVSLLLKHKANINQETQAGQTPLLMASCNGHPKTVQLLLQQGADATIRTKHRLESPLYYATGNGHKQIIELLIQSNPDLLKVGTNDGAVPLHVATTRRDIELIKFLVESKADVNQKKQGNITALHIASCLPQNEYIEADSTTGYTNIKKDVKIDELIKILLEQGCNLNERDNFGTTPLHKACTNKNYQAALVLINAGADVNIKDEDELTPLHSLCSAPLNKKVGPMVESQTKLFDLLIERGADLNATDKVGSTPLHHAVCRSHNMHLVRRILDISVDSAFILDKSNRTPLHLLLQMYPNEESEQLLKERMQKLNPHFFDDFNPKQLNSPKRSANQLTPEEMHAVLNGDVSLNGIVKKIKSGEIKNILVLTGAGISTNAGIPDFRSPETGMYTNPELKQRLKLSPTDAFSLHGLQHEPQTFYTIVKEIFGPVLLGNYKPTKTHKFIRLLEKKGLLLRNYTQNIDILENIVGISEDKVVQGHGSFASARCTLCSNVFKTDSLESPFWKTVLQGGVPTCDKCSDETGKNVVRPDVVLFGEPLPSRFFDLKKTDALKCDLLIVAGTSLLVYPFAGLPNEVSKTCPRLMFNKTPTGLFSKANQETILNNTLTAMPNTDNENYRDVVVLGDIDEGVSKFIQLLGWGEENN